MTTLIVLHPKYPNNYNHEGKTVSIHLFSQSQAPRLPDLLTVCWTMSYSEETDAFRR